MSNATPIPDSLSPLQRLTEPSEQHKLQSDMELLELYCASDDRAAIEALIRRYSAMVASVCSLTVADPSSAEDAFQATFLILLKSAKKIRSRSSVAAWLHGVAYRCASRLRKQNSQKFHNQSDPDVLAFNSNCEDPLAKLARQMDLEALARELEKLPEQLRAPLIEFYMLGYTAPQIAERMELSVAAIEGRLKRGRHALRSRLAKRGISMSVLIAGSTLFQEHLAASEAACWTQQFLQNFVLQCDSVSAESTFVDTPQLQIPNSQLSSLVRGETSMVSTTLFKACATAGVLLVAGAVAAFSVSAQDQPGHSVAPKSSRVTIPASPIERTVMAQLAPQIPPPADNSLQAATENPVEVVEWMRPQNEAGAEPTWLTNVRDAWDAVEKNRAVLSQKVSVDFNATPLLDVVSKLSDECGIQFELNQAEIELEGMADADTPVTLKAEASVREILRRILDQHELTYTVQESTIEITTKDHALESPRTRYYDLSYVLPNSSNINLLVSAIQTTVAPLDWDVAGGQSTIAIVGSMMVVAATDTAHHEIEAFLHGISKMNPANAKRFVGGARGDGGGQAGLGGGMGGGYMGGGMGGGAGGMF